MRIGAFDVLMRTRENGASSPKKVCHEQVARKVARRKRQVSDQKTAYGEAEKRDCVFGPRKGSVADAVAGAVVDHKKSQVKDRPVGVMPFGLNAVIKTVITDASSQKAYISS